MNNEITAPIENCNPSHIDKGLDELFEAGDSDSEVVRFQGTIDVRGDEQGNVVIRQRGPFDDEFVDVNRAYVLKLCLALLREAGFHGLTITKIDEVKLRDRDGNPITVRASECSQLAKDFEVCDRISEEERLERIAERVPWERRSRTKPKDRTAAERQRRHRAKRDGEADVTRGIVTERDSHGLSASSEALR